MCRYVAGAMESNATGACTGKKLKREAAQRRKAQAKSLKLRAEEQERLQRLEIDALVEQERLQRLERQRHRDDAERLALKAAGMSFKSSCCKDDSGKAASPSASKQQAKPAAKQLGAPQVHQQKQQDRAPDSRDNRRRLARGRNGALESVPSGCCPDLPMEDHRVVSTEYQAAGTQALMRVTLLAAGFVIGARGISARLIGQITGAIIQSWTESSGSRYDNSNDSNQAMPVVAGIPIRLFRIQGRKAVVQAAVALVEQAVAKYKELCECKRRGEFVQREHVINGVEFYYQPPPRKAMSTAALPLSTSAASTGSSNGGGSGAASVSVMTPPFRPHHVWLHHHLQQEQEAGPDHKPVCPCHCTTSTSDGKAPAWTNGNTARSHLLQVESSLFSIFGNGGLPLPLPIVHNCPLPNAAHTSASSTPFDFPKYDFLREILPSFLRPEQQSKENNLLGCQQEELCMVCVERP